ncbi:bifunctional metallophosphatase/5'-nucleotidase [Aquibaculum arenosum]|uniref:Bifunctional UDP-sugar hydrolase/5'-nucleotidase n=1 Tax=Aquibaculum arenosum TaxID=3032591 RepID=A0ABT5YNM4_9PROT|nr:bifunctional UDP-sugar hydrolase/5'-nucleotidase [Fodinicurvata sp. CAU 1616]MDF2096340.1 bifunctional UDP-sugar hydrolase/5'-nucleotidase [Fodinicurvata sp. CAU 1616]
MLRLLLVVSVFLIGLSPQPQLRADHAGERDPLRLVIVHVSDLDRIEARGGRGGLAKLASVVGTLRLEHEHVLVTHGGDAVSPSVMSNFDQGAHMIDLLNRLDLDLFVLGNHEFDFGPEVTLERVAEADFPVLGSNLRRSDGTKLPGVEDEIILEIAGWHIGVMGLLTPQTLTSSSPGDIAFTSEVDAAAERAASLRAEGADFVVALVHSGYDVDTALVRQGAVDLVLGAHDHLQHLLWPTNGTAFVEAGAQANHVAIIEILLQEGEDSDNDWSAQFRFLDTLEITPDPDMQQAVQGYLADFEEELGRPLAITEVALDTRGSSLRSEENAFGNLIADAFRVATEADVAIQNAGGIRGHRHYAKGSILTKGDVIAELPFQNPMVLLEVDGETLWQIVEHGLAAVEQRSGRFPQVSGLSIVYDPQKLPGERLLELHVQDQPLESDALYRLAVNGFNAKGGDGYEMLTELPRLSHPADGLSDTAVLMRHLEQAERIAPRIEGRIRVP